MRLTVHTCSMFILLAAWFGCNPLDSSVLLRPNEYAESEEKNIMVFTTDGREIHFGAGQHHFVQRADSLFLLGSGVLHRLNRQYVGKKFEGEIPENLIDRIEVPRLWDPVRFGGVLAAICIIIPLAYYGLR